MELTFRFYIFTIFSLFSILILTVPTINSETSKKKEITLTVLSADIHRNPFLSSQNIRNDIQSDNINVNKYRDNPFLSSTSVYPISFPSKNNEQDKTSVSFNLGEKTNKHNLQFNIFISNPFLQNIPNKNNLTETISTNNAHSTQKISTNEYEPHPLFGTKTKSEIKCEEYGKQFLSTAGVLPLVGVNVEVTQVANQKCNKSNNLVVGGVSASPGEFPHMVALGTRNAKGSFIISCGGTLIAPEWVLTAAHCTYGPKAPSEVRIGFHNLRDNQGIITTINETIVHPSYSPPAMYADIALLKLNTAVAFNENIRPACLYQEYDTVPSSAWVCGWGVTEFGEDVQSNLLQKAHLDIFDHITCAMNYGESISVPSGIRPSMICAGDPRGWSKDTCQGDSGGPLQIVHPTNACLFQVLGITSFGKGCAFINVPGVYTRVSYYLTWIEDIVWP